MITVFIVSLCATAFISSVVGLLSWRNREQAEARRQSEETLRLRNAELEALALKNARLYASLEQELTERRRTEIALAEARDIAEASSRAKSAFISNMSHELRTPLTAIIGYAQLIKLQLAAGDTASLSTELDIIIKSARYQVTMINNLLDLAKIEAGHMQLQCANVELTPLLHEVGQMVRPLIEQANNQLVVKGPASDELIYGDEQKIRQILINLLSNAAKFTEHGTITLHAERVYIEGKSWLQLRVSDTGIGIPATMLATIFGEFTQIGSKYQQKYSGTGLGLSICKHYAELMGGWINVESKEHHGSQFYVNLPCRYIDEFDDHAELHANVVGGHSRERLNTLV
jgi:signal transduction histidine kinase